MEWQDSLPASTELFPSMESSSEIEGFYPVLPKSDAVFAFLQPESTSGLKSQLLLMLEKFTSSPQNPLDSGASVDEKNGKVIVESSAVHNYF